ncbi:hypothetical protein LXL04_007900 [Taraxacum kok-saghyz]
MLPPPIPFQIRRSTSTEQRHIDASLLTMATEQPDFQRDIDRVQGTYFDSRSKAVNENQGKLELRCWWIANQIRRIQGFGKGIGGYYLLEAQREETKGPHSSLSESLFQNSVTGKYSRFLLFLLF